MKIRSTLFQVLLALLLLFTQQMAIAHTSAHLGEPARSSTQDQQIPHEYACDQCLAFASVGSALASPLLAFTVAPADTPHVAIEASTGLIPATTLPFNTRAPPSRV